MVKATLWGIIFQGILSILLTDLGLKLLVDFPDNRYLGISMIIIAFSAFYIVFYSLQIRENQNKIEQMENKLGKLETNVETSKELLNSLKDIVILRKVKKE